MTNLRVNLWPIQLQSWGMRDFSITDPSGVLWRIGQNVDECRKLDSSRFLKACSHLSL